MHNIDFPQFLFTLQNEQQHEETNNRAENIYRTEELQVKYEFYGFQSEDENVNTSEEENENNIEYCKTTINNPTDNCDSGDLNDNESEASLHTNDEHSEEENISKDDTSQAKSKPQEKKTDSQVLQEDDDYDMTENGEYKCGKCGKIYLLGAFLKMHLNKNCGGALCKICGQKFRSISAVNKHLPVHSKDKNYQCKRCGNAYKYKSTLQAHYKYHDEFKYVCRICDKKFFTGCKLKVHLSQHAGIYPYKCKICRRTYYSYLRFLRHLQIKHRNTVHILNETENSS